jgi:prepilin-type N-terminal cleavage/methylation domain-containing protein
VGHRPTGATRGFTIIEVLISLLLVLLAAAAGFSILAATVSATQFSAGAQVASRLGQDVLDQAMAEPYLSGGTGSVLGQGGSVCQSATVLPALPDRSNASDPNNTACPQTAGVRYLRADLTAADAGAPAPGNGTTYARWCTTTTVNNLAVVTTRLCWVDGRDGRTHWLTMGVQRAPSQ